MSKGKKLVIGTLAAVAILAGSLGGYVALADSGGDATDSNQESMAPPGAPFLERVAEILDIEEQDLKDAVAQARREMVGEALERRLDKLVEEDIITEGEKQEYLDWWQNRPDVPVGFGLRGHLHSRGPCDALPRGQMFGQGSPPA